ncbi:hypothetical protein [Nocardia higoensis]|uniref:hypothetical protein n=1 Tax=Nocardia higoensis TaxID=228599 RepID=UPI0002E6494A|nr:hypothetical protein [Nocardia higoensis]
MAERIEIDPYALDKAADITLTAAGEVERIIGNLTSALALEDDATNFPWGNDSFGKKFADGGKGYKASRDALLEGGRSLVRGTKGFADGQKQAAALMLTADGAQ